MHLTVGPLLRGGILAGLLVIIASVIGSMIAYPQVVTTNGDVSGIYLGLLAGAVLLYSAVALFGTCPTTPAAQRALHLGARWGLACSAVWIVEVLIANVVGPQLGPLNAPLYYSTALAGFGLPLLGAGWAAHQTGRLGAGLQAGLLCGMLGGLILFLAALAIPALLIGFTPDAQTLAEFRRSGAPDLQTFLVGDFFAALIAHLWIGLITGGLFGLIGGAIGAAWGSRVRD